MAPASAGAQFSLVEGVTKRLPKWRPNRARIGSESIRRRPEAAPRSLLKKSTKNMSIFSPKWAQKKVAVFTFFLILDRTVPQASPRVPPEPKRGCPKSPKWNQKVTQNMFFLLSAAPWIRLCATPKTCEFTQRVGTKTNLVYNKLRQPGLQYPPPHTHTQKELRPVCKFTQGVGTKTHLVYKNVTQPDQPRPPHKKRNKKTDTPSVPVHTGSRNQNPPSLPKCKTARPAKTSQNQICPVCQFIQGVGTQTHLVYKNGRQPGQPRPPKTRSTQCASSYRESEPKPTAAQVAPPRAAFMIPGCSARLHPIP